MERCGKGVMVMMMMSSSFSKTFVVAMSTGENRRLVADELVEFGKSPVVGPR